MSDVEVGIMELADACERVMPKQGPSVLTRALEEAGSVTGLSHVLTRSGWHRLGGVVDGAYQRVADNITRWAEAQGDVDTLMARYGDSGYFATHWQGRTHYLVAPTGDDPEDFLQVEVEELQEVIDRFLVDPDWYPETLEEFVDPLELPRLEPEPVGPARYVFRRATHIGTLLDDLDPASGTTRGLRRFFTDWSRSSAAAASPCCRHWVLALRATPDLDGGTRFSARPAATHGITPRNRPDPDGLEGAELANWMHAIDQRAGYGFAWYFFMLASRVVPVSVADQAHRDLVGGFDYLPVRDTRILRDWIGEPYTF